MPIVISAPGDLDLAAFRRVAWDGEPVELGDAAVDRMTTTRRAFEEFVSAAGERRLYGITTAHDRGAETLLSPEARIAYAQRIPPTPASFGSPLPERVVRGIVAARVSGFVSGEAAVRPEVAQAVAAMLSASMPTVPARGHGEPGEVGILRAVFGELEDKLELQAKEGMALINGAPAAAAALADIAVSGVNRLAVAEEIFALAFDGAQAPEAHLDPALDDAWCDPYEAAALTRLRELLGGNVVPRAGHQSAVAFRDTPRLLGWQRRLQSWIEECATISLAAPGNNPIFVAHDYPGRSARILSNAGYHDARAAPMINAIARGWADLAALAAVQATRLAESGAGLAARESQREVTLLSMTALGWAEEARHGTGQTLISLGGSPPSDTSSPALLAWRLAEDTGTCLQAVLVTLAVLAVHTMLVEGRRPPEQLRDRFERVRARFPPGTHPREYSVSLEEIGADIQKQIHNGTSGA